MLIVPARASRPATQATTTSNNPVSAVVALRKPPSAVTATSRARQRGLAGSGVARGRLLGSAPMPFRTRIPVTRSVAAAVAVAKVLCSRSARRTSGRASSRDATRTMGTPVSTASASTGEAANSTALPATSAASALAVRAYAVTIWPVRSASELARPICSPGRPGAPPAGSSTRAATRTRTSRPARSRARSISQYPTAPQLARTTKTPTTTASHSVSADPSPVPTARSSTTPTTTGTAASDSWCPTASRADPTTSRRCPRTVARSTPVALGGSEGEVSSYVTPSWASVTAVMSLGDKFCLQRTTIAAPSINPFRRSEPPASHRGPRDRCCTPPRPRRPCSSSSSRPAVGSGECAPGGRSADGSRTLAELRRRAGKHRRAEPQHLVGGIDLGVSAVPDAGVETVEEGPQLVPAGQPGPSCVAVKKSSAWLRTWARRTAASADSSSTAVASGWSAAGSSGRHQKRAIQ